MEKLKLKELKQEDIILTIGSGHLRFTNTDNVTNLIGEGEDHVTALQDHIVDLILYYENKLKNG